MRVRFSSNYVAKASDLLEDILVRCVDHEEVTVEFAISPKSFKMAV